MIQSLNHDKATGSDDTVVLPLMIIISNILRSVICRDQVDWDFDWNYYFVIVGPLNKYLFPTQFYPDYVLENIKDLFLSVYESYPLQIFLCLRFFFLKISHLCFIFFFT